MFQGFSTLELRQSLFDLSNKPFVVTNQTLNGFVDQ